MDYDQTKQAVREWVEKQQQLIRKARFVEYDQRKNNKLLFELQEEKNVYLETLGVVEKFVRDIMNVEITNWKIEYMSGLEEEEGKC
jgi:hypothetical protein